MTGPALRVTLSRPWLIVRFRRDHEVLSSALIGGGRRRVRTVTWHEVRNNELPPSVDPVRLLLRRMAERGLPESVGLLTSRDVDRYVAADSRHDGVSAQVVATVGLGNALRIGDRPGVRAKLGTINILCRVSEALSEAALIEAYALVAEARTLAVLEAGVASRRSGRPSTGTGTDCIVVAAPAGRRRAPYAGKHTSIGHVVGAAVLKALRAGVAAWTAEQ